METYFLMVMEFQFGMIKGLCRCMGVRVVPLCKGT